MKVLTVYAHEPEPDSIGCQVLENPSSPGGKDYWLIIDELRILIEDPATVKAIIDKASALYLEMTPGGEEVPC